MRLIVIVCIFLAGMYTNSIFTDDCEESSASETTVVTITPSTMIAAKELVVMKDTNITVSVEKEKHVFDEESFAEKAISTIAPQKISVTFVMEKHLILDLEKNSIDSLISIDRNDTKKTLYIRINREKVKQLIESRVAFNQSRLTDKTRMADWLDSDEKLREKAEQEAIKTNQFISDENREKAVANTEGALISILREAFRDYDIHSSGIIPTYSDSTINTITMPKH